MRVRRNEADMSWSELARLDRLSAVLDPADTRGGKNRLIDRTHKYALGRAIGEIDGAAVLDFGCGTGRLSGWLAGRGACVAGVDATSEMVAVARQAVPEASFETIDGRTLPFADGRFDVVITAYVLQYYVGGDGGIARELARVLRSGGRFAAIEQVTQDDLGRGGPAAASTIRLSDSRVVRVAQRYPALSRLPLAPWLVAREAALKSEGPLVGGRYADALFVARKR
jgi:ubiquinone/menaquinone biosynthesis C-methylase UbiE